MGIYEFQEHSMGYLRLWYGVTAQHEDISVI
jgi:hypothetical protein